MASQQLSVLGVVVHISGWDFLYVIAFCAMHVYVGLTCFFLAVLVVSQKLCIRTAILPLYA